MGVLLLLVLAIGGCVEAPSTVAEATEEEPMRYDTTEAVATHGLGRPWLSDYGFFTGPLADLRPAENVVAYDLNAPLFSDYAEKSRFVYFPDGTTAEYDGREVLDFPEGAVIIKNFYYDDHTTEVVARRIIETRLLVKREGEWQPLSYVWDEAQTNAKFAILGANVPVRWTNANGMERELEYVVPDLNQCKSCHAFGGKTRPIGPSARQLNKPYAFAASNVNQLDYLTTGGWLKGLPPVADRPRLANYHEHENNELDARALAYLDANCGHCHRPEGSAKTSGLDLTVYETDPYRRGVNKPPVAAGKASGDRLYSIVPGEPDASILLYRMEHNDPAIAMPEIGRKLVHEEGVALIREWISKMETSK